MVGSGNDARIEIIQIGRKITMVGIRNGAHNKGTKRRGRFWCMATITEFDCGEKDCCENEGVNIAVNWAELIDVRDCFCIV